MSTSRLRAGSCTVGAVRARQLQYRTTGTQAARAPGPLAQHGASATARRCRAIWPYARELVGPGRQGDLLRRSATSAPATRQGC